MIAAALLALAVSTQRPATAPWCRGVAIDTPEGRANFVWIIAEGSDQDLQRIATAARSMRLFNVIGPRSNYRGQTQLVVYFQTLHGQPAQTTNPADALAFLQRAQQGEFGPLTVRPMIMGIDTLPADRC